MNLLPTLRYPGSNVLHPLPWLQRAAMILAVLGALGFCIDAALMHPLFRTAWQAVVTRPIERRWGFHAERREIHDYEWVVIASVVPGGPFDQAGIRPGWVVWDPGCTLCSMNGGMYGALARASDRAVLPFWENEPGRRHVATKVVVKRKPAA